MPKWLLRIRVELTCSHLERAKCTGPAQHFLAGAEGVAAAPTLLLAPRIGCTGRASVRRDSGKARTAGLSNRQDTRPDHAWSPSRHAPASPCVLDPLLASRWGPYKVGTTM